MESIRDAFGLEALCIGGVCLFLLIVVAPRLFWRGPVHYVDWRHTDNGRPRPVVREVDPRRGAGFPLILIAFLALMLAVSVAAVFGWLAG